MLRKINKVQKDSHERAQKCHTGSEFVIVLYGEYRQFLRRLCDLRFSGVGRTVTDTVHIRCPQKKKRNPCVIDTWVSPHLQNACRYVSFRNTTVLHKTLVLTKDRFFAWQSPLILAPKLSLYFQNTLRFMKYRHTKRRMQLDPEVGMCSKL